ncbi:uncharacterized, partial [Tachysurus ichikawai]
VSHAALISSRVSCLRLPFAVLHIHFYTSLIGFLRSSPTE